MLITNHSSSEASSQPPAVVVRSLVEGIRRSTSGCLASPSPQSPLAPNQARAGNCPDRTGSSVRSVSAGPGFPSRFFPQHSPRRCPATAPWLSRPLVEIRRGAVVGAALSRRSCLGATHRALGGPGLSWCHLPATRGRNSSVRVPSIFSGCRFPALDPSLSCGNTVLWHWRGSCSVA